MEDFGDLAISDSEDAQKSRTERVEQARKTSKSYTAKLEEPAWFVQDLSLALSSSTLPKQQLIRVQLHLQYLYYTKFYAECLDGCLALLSSAGTLDTEDRRGKLTSGTAEVIDMALQSALKCGRTDEVLHLARKGCTFAQTAPGIALSASDCYAASNHYADAVDSFLIFFHIRGPLPKIVDRFNVLLQNWAGASPDYAALIQDLVHDLDNFEMERIEELPLSEKGKEMLRDYVAVRTKSDGKEEEELVSDVRNL